MAGRTAPATRPTGEKVVVPSPGVSPYVASASPPPEAAAAVAALITPVKELIIKGSPQPVKRPGSRGKGLILLLLGAGAITLVAIALQVQAKRSASQPIKEELSFPRELTLRDSPEPEPIDHS